MQALIFAAGLGERMRPLTNATPKPLLPVAGKPLIVWHLEKLAALGVQNVVINTSWLADQFPQMLGDGGRWGLNLQYSKEPYPPLETGGGMLNAWQKLDLEKPLIVVNGDVWTDFDFAKLPTTLTDTYAHLVMIDNPMQHPQGDFNLSQTTDILHIDGEGTRLTFSGIGVYHHRLFDHWRSVIGNIEGAALTPPRFRLAPLLIDAMQANHIRGQYHSGRWTDVGTPQRLADLDASLHVDP